MSAQNDTQRQEFREKGTEHLRPATLIALTVLLINVPAGDIRGR